MKKRTPQTSIIFLPSGQIKVGKRANLRSNGPPRPAEIQYVAGEDDLELDRRQHARKKERNDGSARHGIPTVVLRASHPRNVGEPIPQIREEATHNAP